MLFMPPPEEELVCVLPRNSRIELRVSLVRFLGKRSGFVAVQEFRRTGPCCPWQPLKARSLIRGCEISLVIEAMQRARERAQELGWSVR